MKPYQIDFIRLALAHNVLKFGEFTLKSGRGSPYFFNAGNFSSGASLATLGRCYAEAIKASGIEFEVLFGPAYKGISLAVTTVIAMNQATGADIPCAFNRKEQKQHGEGGSLIGATLGGRVLIIDDVITAGTAVREVVELIRGAGAEVAGVVVGLDRAERGKDGRSALSELSNELRAPIVSIINLNDIIGFIERDEQYAEHLPAIRAYRAQWGAATP